MKRFWDKVRKTDTCWIWTASIRNKGRGYGQFCLNGKMVRAHRVAYELEHGPIPQGMHVCHTCDNESCVRPSHLFLGTHTDNMQDKTAKGRGNQPKGEAAGLAKLTEEQVREIRARYYAGGVRQVDLANEFGVAQTTISSVVRKLTWTPSA